MAPSRSAQRKPSVATKKRRGKKDEKKHVVGFEGTYTGDLPDGVREGSGALRWANGATYEGSFKGGMRDGEGVYTMGPGRVYEGGSVRGGAGRCCRACWHTLRMRRLPDLLL